jgi:hypothetical protein
MKHPQPNHGDDNNSETGDKRATLANTLFLFFVSTTGEGEHCDSIQQTWKAL